MKLFKPKFWNKRNFFSYSLFPLSIISQLFNLLKKTYIVYNFKIKTICVGNIYIGGTGKTSLTIEINNILKKNYNTVLIKKNYKNQFDEIFLLRNYGNVIFNENRITSLKIAEAKKYDIAILDDGLQQKNINYDLKIVCFNSQEGVGNEYVLPAGPLRENLNEIKNYDIAFLNGEKTNNKLIKKIKSINKNIKIFEAKYKPKNLTKLDKKKNYLMFCGIGNPQEFENTLHKYKLKIKKKIILPDHYNISDKEIKNIKKIAKKNKLKIVTTEKDFLRLKKNNRKNIKVLKVELHIKKLLEFKKLLTL